MAKRARMGQDADGWRCACSFQNRAANTVCGGNGNMGCKQPRAMPGGGPMAMNAYMPGVPMMQDAAWSCASCNFKNRPQNDICGGNGPAGCNAPRQSRGLKRPAAAMTFQMPHPAMAMMMGGGGGNWPCPSCGFNNKPHNTVCGGQGPMGCKVPRGRPMPMPMMQPSYPMMHPMQMMMMMGGKGAGKADGPMWLCACGFKNTARNAICGGKGPKGCNEPKPEDWVCECGFKNRPNNDVCGGKGNMGCNLPRADGEVDGDEVAPTNFAGKASKAKPTSSMESAWICDCGFQNKEINAVCGGKGNMGCKEPRPDQ